MYIPDLLLLSLIKRKLFACSSDVHKFVAKSRFAFLQFCPHIKKSTFEKVPIQVMTYCNYFNLGQKIK